MYETAGELHRLQELLDRSLASSSEHLRDIIKDDRVLSAADVGGLLTGMKVVTVATVTAAGHPRISAMDGHFLHGTWSFSTSAASAKARHMRARPDVSVAHVDGEELAVFSHGRVAEASPEDPDWDETLQHWTSHYGSSPLTWGDDVRLYRYEPHWMVGYAFQREELLRRRGIGS
jgi:general stress protein 26